MSVAVWVMMGIAMWHFAVYVPDRFWGGIVGALLASVAGALLTGFALPSPGVPAANPPGVQEALWAVPGSIGGMVMAYFYGARKDKARDIEREPVL